jgi:hypothetical protein
MFLGQSLSKVPSPITVGSMSLSVRAMPVMTRLGFIAGLPRGASPVSRRRRNMLLVS